MKLANWVPAVEIGMVVLLAALCLVEEFYLEDRAHPQPQQVRRESRQLHIQRTASRFVERADQQVDGTYAPF